MDRPPLFIYTNIPAPYYHHFWQKVSQEFPGSAVIFTESLESHKDRVWKDQTAAYDYPCFNLHKDFSLPGLGYFSTSLFTWLWRRAHGALHMLWSCGRGNNYVLRYLAPLLGGRLIHCIDGALPDSLTAAAIKRYKQRFLPAMAAAFGPGRAGRDHFLKLGFQQEQIFNSYFSHEVEFFTSEREEKGTGYRSQLRKAMDIPSDHLVLLTVSRLLDWKRIEDLRDALRSLEARGSSGLHLLLIGDGDHTAPVMAMEQELKLISFHWIKGVPYQDMPKYYAMSDVLVFPSEGDIWGLVVNEALSMGIPVICTDRIGAAELVRDGENGFLVPPRTPGLIADRITRLVSDRDLLARLSESALDIQERWNTRLGLENLKKIVNYVLERDKVKELNRNP